MTAIILLVALVVEAVFAAYCIITKSKQMRVKNFIRIGALAAFVLFALAAVIRWSFAWYGLALLLLIWAVLGAWALIRKQVEKKAYKP